MGQFDKFIQALRKSCDHKEALAALSDYLIPNERPLKAPESITFDAEIKLDDVTPHSGLLSDIATSRVQLSNITELHKDILTANDKKDLSLAITALDRIKERHQEIVNRIHLEGRVANKVKEAVAERESIQNQVVTDAQKALTRYQHDIDRIGTAIAKTVQCERQLKYYEFNFETMSIKPNTNPVGNLEFVCKLNIGEITPVLLSQLIEGLIGKQKTIDTVTSSRESIKDAIKSYPDDEEDPIEVLASRFEAALDKKLEPKKSIIREEDDVYDELSQGYNAQMYFALMADRNVGEGIYIVDQPEDQISQKAIKESVLGEFRDIANSRQVILITHNPQFVVNLDVDNVIFIGKTDDALFIRSGALEYECDEYSMLETVAENIEGGLETIQKRMKRYEKAN